MTGFVFISGTSRILADIQLLVTGLIMQTWREKLNVFIAFRLNWHHELHNRDGFCQDWFALQHYAHR